MPDVSRVECNEEILIDLTEDTVTPASLRTGVTAHNAAGDLITGVGGDIYTQTEIILKDTNDVPWHIRVSTSGSLTVTSS